MCCMLAYFSFHWSFSNWRGEIFPTLSLRSFLLIPSNPQTLLNSKSSRHSYNIKVLSLFSQKTIWQSDWKDTICSHQTLFQDLILDFVWSLARNMNKVLLLRWVLLLLLLMRWVLLENKPWDWQKSRNVFKDTGFTRFSNLVAMKT